MTLVRPDREGFSDTTQLPLRCVVEGTSLACGACIALGRFCDSAIRFQLKNSLSVGSQEKFVSIRDSALAEGSPVHYNALYLKEYDLIIKSLQERADYAVARLSEFLDSDARSVSIGDGPPSGQGGCLLVDDDEVKKVIAQDENAIDYLRGINERCQSEIAYFTGGRIERGLEEEVRRFSEMLKLATACIHSVKGSASQA